MGLVKTVETNASSFYKGFPHLPQTARTWLGANIWWLTLIGLILIGFVLFPFFAFLGPLSLLFMAFGGPVGAALGGIALLVGLLFLGFFIIEFILFAMAITPLRNGQKRGWNLLLAALMATPLAMLPSILTFDIGAVVMQALMLLLGGYLLFEIRGHFVAKKPKK